MKKFLALLLALVMTLALAACGGSGNTPANNGGNSGNASDAGGNSGGEDTTEPAGEQVGAGKVIGIAMPTQSSERWINDGANMKAQLEALGYEVQLQYAEDDPQTQVSQVEGFVAQQVDCLVIAAIDGGPLVPVEEQAKAAGIPVIAYDRLLKDTDAVKYYASFDNEGVGTAIGQYIKDAKDLEAARAAGESYTIEFFMGSPDDNNAVLLHKGIMGVLEEYLNDGTLVCKTGRTSFDDTCILRWSQETAQQMCENYLSGYYADEPLDIACSAFDGFSYGIRSALESAGYTDANWPLITGQDAELMAVKNIISGKQTMSIYKDTRLLAEKCVGMVNAVLSGTEPEINDTTTYDNNVLVVPSYLCTPIPVDKDNYEEIIVEGGYYTADQLAG